jgi:hypothetical protein
MKKVYSLKFQFILLFSIFIISSSSITAIFAVQRLSESVIDTFSRQGKHIVEKAVSLIDGDSFETLVKSMDKDDPYY